MSEVKWIKLSTDTFSDEKIRLIETLPEADTILVIWFKLLSLAGRTNAGGYLIFNTTIPYTDEMLATLFGRKLATVRLALQTFERFGMIEYDTEQTIYIANWEKHQNVDGLEKIREQNRVRQQKYREQQKHLTKKDTKLLEAGASSSPKVTNAPHDPSANEVQNTNFEVQNHENEVHFEVQNGVHLGANEVQNHENEVHFEGQNTLHTQNEREVISHESPFYAISDVEVHSVTQKVTLHNALDKEEELEKEKHIVQVAPAPLFLKEGLDEGANATTKDYTHDFLQFWELYPLKKGKKEAFTKFKVAIKQHALQEILNGTRAYALECVKEQRDAKYIKHAKTFLHNEIYTEYKEDTQGCSPKPSFKGIGEREKTHIEGETDPWLNETKDDGQLKKNSSGLL